MSKIAALVFSAVCVTLCANPLHAAAPPAGAATAASQPATAPAGARQDFVRSLTLRTDRIIADSTHPSIVWLAQTSAVTYRPTGAVTVSLALGDARVEFSKMRSLGAAEVSPRDLVSRPFAMSAEFDGVPDGNYVISAELREGENFVASFQQSIWLVKGIDARRAGIVERLAKIEGHESTKATIMYPFDLARVVNAGRRGYNEQDLGINEAKQVNYLDFPKEMKHSEDLLAALEAGKDLLWQAKGDNKRHYYFAEANEISPYHIYVPTTWDGKTALPMVFILHGNTRNQDFYFDRDAQIIPKSAEKHGFMLVGVFGYHPNGGYNLSSMQGAGRGGGRGGAVPAFGPAVAGGAPGRAGGGGGGGANSFMNGMPQARLTELSEIDTMHVYDLVKKEYPIDPKQIYLFGYSAGGNGGYYIGGKYADNWAAIALGGANTSLSGMYPYYDKFKSLNTPFFIYYGEKDNVGPGSTASVQALSQKGIAAQLKSYPGVDHDGGPAAGVADAFDFFAAHARK